MGGNRVQNSKKKIFYCSIPNPAMPLGLIMSLHYTFVIPWYDIALVVYSLMRPEMEGVITGVITHEADNISKTWCI